ncbi:MAG: DUF1254 domain-containing protein [Pseudomonadota bacterium]|nr:DUF1254 domain-containing protein [Pseudomonadota bacterium]
MKLPSPARLLYYAALIGVVAALTHLVALLLVPSFAARDAFARVEALGPPFKTVALPAPGPQARDFPYADPAVAASVCVYDLSAGPVRASAPLGRAVFASLSFHSRRGVAFYALTDRAANKGRMEALIVTAEQLRALVAHDDEDNPSDDLRIVSPTLKGFVMARALSGGLDLLAQAAEQAGAMTCAAEPIAEAEK